MLRPLYGFDPLNSRQALLLPSKQGQDYFVPEWEPDSNVWIQMAARVSNAFAQERFGLPVTLLEIRPGAQLKGNDRRARAYFLCRNFT